MPGESPLKGFGILTPLQKEFLEVFSGLPDQSQFYLTGGTALAEYYLGHPARGQIAGLLWPRRAA
jgi:hypothetical protein